MKAPLRAIRDPCTMARRRAIAEIVATAATVDATAAAGHHADTRDLIRGLSSPDPLHARWRQDAGLPRRSLGEGGQTGHGLLNV